MCSSFLSSCPQQVVYLCWLEKDTQKLLSKNGETLLGAINFFISSVNTLVDKTIEDTMLNIKQYEVAR